MSLPVLRPCSHGLAYAGCHECLQRTIRTSPRVVLHIGVHVLTLFTDVGMVCEHLGGGRSHYLPDTHPLVEQAHQAHTSLRRP